MSETAGDTIERGTGVALWRQIEEQLRVEIAAGALLPGTRLPTEHSLAARFCVNRHTVRRALAALVQRGLVRVEQGRGAFVQEDVIDYVLGKRTRFTENILRHRREPSGVLLEAHEIAASQVAGRALDLPPGAPLVALLMVREADGLPLSLARHCFPASRVAGIADAYRELGTVTQALARCGIADYTRQWTRLTARLPTAEEARRLRQPPTVPVLQSEAVNIDDRGRPIEYGVTAFAGSRVHILVEG
jgi:GntR family transcriptional regulator, phosphonate transport system regulatory protein